MSAVDFNAEGPWRTLWPAALDLMSHLESMISNAHWTFGGGTVLMLRYDHRLSKDIDLFVPDPQYLGHVNPRLGGPAEDLTSEYEVNAEFIKLYLPQGEIDVVVGAALTGESFVVRSSLEGQCASKPPRKFSRRRCGTAVIRQRRAISSIFAPCLNTSPKRSRLRCRSWRSMRPRF